jgi:hypothetical protein
VSYHADNAARDLAGWANDPGEGSAAAVNARVVLAERERLIEAGRSLLAELSGCVSESDSDVQQAIEGLRFALDGPR